MPLQELLNQYEILWEGGSGPAPPSTGSPFNWKIYTGLNRYATIWFVAGIVPPIPPAPPVVIIPGNFGSTSLPGFIVLGTVYLTPTPMKLNEIFPQFNIQGASSATVIFCTHQSNSATDIIYIGDGAMTSEFNAATSLKGPNVIYKIENQAGYNSVGLANISLASNVSTAQCRITSLAN